jgi:hypothetical protein
MRDYRQTLHELVEQAPEEDLPQLVDLMKRFLHPLDFPLQGEVITFVPKEPGTPASEPDEIEQRRRTLLWEAHSGSRWNQLVRQQRRRAVERLGLDLESLGMPRGGGSSGGSNDTVEQWSDWQAGSRRHRLRTFYLQGQEVITFERAQVSETGSELIYTLRVLTPNGEAEGEVRLPFPPEQPRKAP